MENYADGAAGYAADAASSRQRLEASDRKHMIPGRSTFSNLRILSGITAMDALMR